LQESCCGRQDITQPAAGPGASDDGFADADGFDWSDDAAADNPVPDAFDPKDDVAVDAGSDGAHAADYPGSEGVAEEPVAAYAPDFGHDAPHYALEYGYGQDGPSLSCCRFSQIPSGIQAFQHLRSQTEVQHM